MRRIAAGAVVILVAVGIFAVRPAPLVSLDYKVCDLLADWAGPGKQSGRVVIVEIDEKSLEQYGRWPWSRETLGRLASRLVDRGATTVVFDMMFPQEDRGPAGSNDQIFASALSGRPTVVGYSLGFDGAQSGSPSCGVEPLSLAVVAPKLSGDPMFLRATDAVCSLPQIANAAAGTGFLNASPDSDGKMRRVPLVIEYRNQYHPSLALAAARVFRHVTTQAITADARGASRLRLDNQLVPLEGSSLMRLRFRGAGRAFPYIPAADVLAGRTPENSLRGKIAVIGGSVAGLQRPVATPVNLSFPDIEIQATAIDNLLQGDTFRRPGTAYVWELALALVVGVISISLSALGCSFLAGTVIILVLAAGSWAACSFALSTNGVLLSPLPATGTLCCGFAVLAVGNYRREKKRADRRERELLSTKAFSLEALLESETRYQRLVENVNDAIIVDDFEGRLVFANRRFREWFGLGEKDIHEVTLEDHVAPEWRPVLRDRHNRRVRGESVPDHYEYEGIRPDGTRIWIEALVTRVGDEAHITGTQAALRDITERKRIEAQYLQAQKMESIGRLAGGVAHDFNNLLTVINGYCDMLLGQSEQNLEDRACLEQIRTAGERAAELTQKLLAVSRKQMAQPRVLDLNLVVAEAETMLGRVVDEDIEFITRLTPELAQVMVDPGLLHQVVMNLVVNARDAMPHGGKITLETKIVDVDENIASQHSGLTPGPYVYLGVADTGIGMSEEVKQHLFEPFFTTKEPGKGTGLGLATVYGIVRQSAGRIGVESELGHGTSVHIYFPRATAGSAEKPRVVAPGASLRGSETVLIVEDQDAVRQFAAAVLTVYGYHVLQSSNGPDAIRQAEQYPGVIHLLLTDVVLPLMNGRVLAGTLNAVRPEMKVLYISGYPEETIGHRGILDSGLVYLAKPFTPEALAAKVREALAQLETPADGGREDPGTSRSAAGGA